MPIGGILQWGAPHCLVCDRLKRLCKAFGEFLEAIHAADQVWTGIMYGQVIGGPGLPQYLYDECTNVVATLSRELELRCMAYQ